MRTLLLLSMLFTISQTYAEEKTMNLSPDAATAAAPAASDPPPQEQEENVIKNTFPVGPYRDGKYEYFGQKDREARDNENESQSQ